LKILLISNSTLHGRGYLDHAEPAIKEILGPAKRILFFPFALQDRDDYAARARERFAAMGCDLTSAHVATDPRKALREADAIFIGGGNTFRLLHALQDLEWLEAIRERIRSGAPYIGSSAGSNVAGPTIKTTNDMPIVQPRSFDALGLVPFQLNPHFLDPDPKSTHMGETREERIAQFHEESKTPVIGLREGAWLRVGVGSVLLGGTRGARIFRRGQGPVEKTCGDELAGLIGAPE
jgi:dipeptidase E